MFNTGSDLPWFQAIERMANGRFAFSRYLPRLEAVCHTLYRQRLQKRNKKQNISEKILSVNSHKNLTSAQ
jgi:hypothetical protein